MKKGIFKRLTAAAAAAACLLLGGCTVPIAPGGAEPVGITGMYTALCTVTVESDDEQKEPLSYGGELNRLGGGLWEMSLTEPETVAGLKISLGAEGLGASLGDLNFNIEPDKIPSKAAFMSIFSALDHAAANTKELNSSETEANLCYTGTNNGKRYTILCDKAKNTPCGLVIGKITVVFASFTITGSAPDSGTATVTTPAVTSESGSVTTVTETVTTVTTAPQTTASSAVTTATAPLTTVGSSATTTSPSETTVTTAPVTTVS